MKFLTYILLIIALFINCDIFSQSRTDFENQKYYYICKTWGFLKYYSQNDENDWDKELLEKLTEIETIESKYEFNTFLDKWLNESLTSKKIKCNKFPNDSLLITDFAWFKDSIFNTKTSKRLKDIKLFYKPHKNKFIRGKAFDPFSFEKDNSFFYTHKTDINIRLLGLFRFWNIIEYFYPYKNQIESKWDLILLQSIPIILQTESETEYHLAIAEICKKLNDSHATIQSSIFNKRFNFSNMKLPFDVRFINNQVVVSNLNCPCQEIEIGDTIINANGSDFMSFYNNNSKYFSASNSDYKYSILANIFVNNTEKQQNLSIIRNGKRNKISINKVSLDSLAKCLNISNDIVSINDSINYLSGINISKKNIKKVFSKNNLKYVIFDLRFYPKNSNIFIIDQILKYTNKNHNKKEVYQEIAFNNKFPGYINTANYNKSKNKYHNNNFFEGKIIGIITEQTKSLPECIALALSVSDNTTLIGNNTAGSPGGVVQVYLPGGITIPLTFIKSLFLGIDYQGKGVKPNKYYKSNISEKDILMLLN